MNRARALAALQTPKKTPSPPAASQVQENVSTENLENIGTSSQPIDSNDTKPVLNEPTIKRDLDEDVTAHFDLWDPMGEDYFSTDNTLQLNPDKEPECVVTGQMTDDYLMVGKHRVCDFFLKHGTCADGEYCSRLHIKPEARDKLRAIQDTNVMKSNKTCLFQHNLLPSELKSNPDALILVSLTSIEAPNKFHFVTPYEQMNFAGFNDDEIQFYIGRVQHSSTFKTKLDKCHEQLALLFDHNYRVDNIKEHIFLEQIVACKHDDGRFYRGAIVEKLDDMDEYRVILIDTGKQAILSRSNIYSIRANCLNDPPMSTMASLRVKAPGGQLHWPKEALQTFKLRVANQKYMLCRVLSLEMDEVYTVDLLNISTRSSLTDELIAGGLAEPTFAK